MPQLRAITDDDADTLLAIYASTRELELALLPGSDEQRRQFLLTQWTWKATAYRSEHPGADFQMITDGGADVGYLFLAPASDGSLRVVDLAVAGTHRGRGLGTAVLSAILDDADRRGVVVGLHVDTTNPARRLYERLGFTEIDDGAGGDALYVAMERRPLS